LERSDDLFKSRAEMLTMSELSYHIDSLGNVYNNRVNNNFNEYKSVRTFRLNSIYFPEEDKYSKASINMPEKLRDFEVYELLDSLPIVERRNAITRSIDYIRDGNTYLSQISESHYWEIKSLKKYEITWNEKLTLSFACLVLFFIGAPLGAIIRKGGLGTPAVISVLFFVVHYVITLLGKKLAEDNIVGTFAGVWAASYIMLPIGIFLTYKATTDSAIMNVDTYLTVFKKIKNCLIDFIRTIKTVREQKKWKDLNLTRLRKLLKK
jgi:lipopolysaccharide export system permease protein